MSARAFPLTRAMSFMDMDLSVRSFNIIKSIEFKGMELGSFLDRIGIDDDDLHGLVLLLRDNSASAKAWMRMRSKLEKFRGCGYTAATEIVREVSRIAEREVSVDSSGSSTVASIMRLKEEGMNEIRCVYRKKLDEAIASADWARATVCCEVLYRIKP